MIMIAPHHPILLTLYLNMMTRKGKETSSPKQGKDQQTLTQMAALVTAGVLGHFLNCMFVKLCRMRYISELVHVINHVLLKKIVHWNRLHWAGHGCECKSLWDRTQALLSTFFRNIKGPKNSATQISFPIIRWPLRDSFNVFFVPGPESQQLKTNVRCGSRSGLVFRGDRIVAALLGHTHEMAQPFSEIWRIFRRLRVVPQDQQCFCAAVCEHDVQVVARCKGLKLLERVPFFLHQRRKHSKISVQVRPERRFLQIIVQRPSQVGWHVGNTQSPWDCHTNLTGACNLRWAPLKRHVAVYESSPSVVRVYVYVLNGW